MARARRTGRRPGRQDTRGAILRAARRMFAEHGFEGASVRQIAGEAQVDPALVHHYFGTKDALFRAVLDLPVDIGQVVDGLLAGDPEQAPERIVRGFLRHWEHPVTGPALVGFLRTVVSRPGPAALVRGFVEARVVPAVAGRLPVPGDPEEVRLRVTLVASQLHGLALARHVLRLEPLASTPTEQVVAAVAPTLRRYLLEEMDLGHARPSSGGARPVDEAAPIDGARPGATSTPAQEGP